MKTYTESHKAYYNKLKKDGIKTYVIRGEKSFIENVKKFVQELRNKK